MAQFDVHRNTGRQRDVIPFVVVVQSSLFESYRRMVVVPLVLQSALGSGLLRSDLNPAFVLEGKAVLLHPLEIVSVSRDSLGERISSLSDQAPQITQALDRLLSQAWH